MELLFYSARSTIHARLDRRYDKNFMIIRMLYDDSLYTVGRNYKPNSANGKTVSLHKNFYN